MEIRVVLAAYEIFQKLFLRDLIMILISNLIVGFSAIFFKDFFYFILTIQIISYYKISSIRQLDFSLPILNFLKLMPIRYSDIVIAKTLLELFLFLFQNIFILGILLKYNIPWVIILSLFIFALNVVVRVLLGYKLR